MKIVVTGGDGRFAKVLKKKNTSLNLIFANKRELNILDVKSIQRFLQKYKPKIVFHTAGLSRPMDIHSKNIDKSIDLNIIGTANVTKICSKLKIKIIYFSTGYVYPGNKGNYKETDAVNPINHYAWSKLGGECAVNMYKNSLILRLTMTEKPFIHDKAFYDFISNFIFHDEIVTILPLLLKEKGVINVGGEVRSIYDFAKIYNPNVKKVSGKDVLKNLNQSMNIDKLKSIIRKKNKKLIKIL